MWYYLTFKISEKIKFGSRTKIAIALGYVSLLLICWYIER